MRGLDLVRQPPKTKGSSLKVAINWPTHLACHIDLAENVLLFRTWECVRTPFLVALAGLCLPEDT